MRNLRNILCRASIALVLVGCGSDDSSSGAPSSPESDAGSDTSASHDASGQSDTSTPSGDDDASPGDDDAASQPDTSTPTGDGGGRWIPAKDTTFFWDLQNAPPDNTKNVGAYDIDGYGNDAAEVSALHAMGKKVVCYMDAGTYEPGRPDSSQIPAALQGSDVEGWPGEKWLDVRPGGPNYAKLQAIMLARFKVCQSKGFDAVEPDNIDSYNNKPGFNTSAADQLAYNKWIASTVHSLGMAVFLKNDLDQIPDLVGDFDGALDEECNKYKECDTLKPFTDANKPVWNAEYTDDGESTAAFCTADVNAGIVGALFSLALDGKKFEPCTNDVGLKN